MAYWIGDKDGQARYAVTAVSPDGLYVIGALAQRKTWATRAGTDTALERIRWRNPFRAGTLQVIWGISSDR